MKSDYTLYPQPYETMYRIQRALAGYVSYLAACNTLEVFTEYLLYEPILRILIAQDYKNIKSEFPCKDLPLDDENKNYMRIDFVAKKDNSQFALEVKWPQDDKNTIDVEKDYKKLVAFHKKHPDSYSFLCVFGRLSIIEELKLSPNSFVTPSFKINEHGIEKDKELEAVYAKFGRTQYGCKIFQIKA